MKRTGVSVILGIVASIASMGVLFYLFIFLNPLKIYEVNSLKWVPILAVIVGLYISGRLNKNTPALLLPLLFIPFIIFKLFNFLYFPFILALIATGVLTLLMTRSSEKFKYNKLGGVGALGIFLFFLFSQPLILEKKDFGYDANGELLNARVIWDFSGKKTLTLPHHILLKQNNATFDIASIKGKTYLITFWATWCAPCIKEKPALEKLKKQLASNDKIAFIDISFDNDQSKWTRYLAKKPALGTQLISQNLQKTSREFNFAGIPMHIIVNPDGTYKKYRSWKVVKNIIEKMGGKDELTRVDERF
ncbi:hypothetical protein BKI52_01880 [marine bacterium AO1-C]|nr:hypothetical protein BKI52_01880 [marine bacterium AO1-C]